jgi:hypothetical protein
MHVQSPELEVGVGQAAPMMPAPNFGEPRIAIGSGISLDPGAQVFTNFEDAEPRVGDPGRPRRLQHRPALRGSRQVANIPSTPMEKTAMQALNRIMVALGAAALIPLAHAQAPAMSKPQVGTAQVGTMASKDGKEGGKDGGKKSMLMGKDGQEPGGKKSLAMGKDGGGQEPGGKKSMVMVKGGQEPGGKKGMLMGKDGQEPGGKKGQLGAAKDMGALKAGAMAKP